MRLAYYNGALWSLGNGLASTTLIIYLARSLGAAGLGISLILAAPSVIGAFRQVAPVMIGRLADRKTFCIACYGISALLLVVIAQLAEPGKLQSTNISLAVVVALWSVYHLFEYAGTVALWSWLGDVAPRRIRGRFIGEREQWMVLTRVVGAVASGLFAYGWSRFTGPIEEWSAYAIPATAGGATMFAALVPLLRMPPLQTERSNAVKLPLPVWKDLVGPLFDPRMRWVILFGMMFSLANGLTQSAQYLYPMKVLSLSYLARVIFDLLMRLGQGAIAPDVGRWIDRVGSKRVMIVSQLIVAAGMLFFLASSTGYWPLLIGAWFCWIAYVGLNVGLPSLILNLAGPRQSAAYVSSFYASAGVIYGVSTVAGGLLVDWLNMATPSFDVGAFTFSHWVLFFLVGWLLRTFAAVPLLFLKENRAS